MPLRKIYAWIIMISMSDFDALDLDGRLLRLLVAVVESGSVTGAAVKLGVTQSAVSHLLDKLRAIVGDPLFVKSGRGVRATARALALAPRARELLRELQQFAASGEFDPARWRATFVIAANDLQRDALLPGLVARLREAAPLVLLRVIPSNAPTAEMLRSEQCRLIISPRAPEGADIVQKKLFEDRYCVFYDAAKRSAPRTRAEYLAADHVSVLYEPNRRLDLDAQLESEGVHRRYVVLASGFAGVPAFLRGTDLVATAPSLQRFGAFRGLAHAAPPVPCPTLPMHMIWGRIDHDDPGHRWLRGELEAVAKKVVGAARVTAPPDAPPDAFPASDEG
jgi:DNA-binding transcriptional LysR family regulator